MPILETFATVTGALKTIADTVKTMANVHDTAGFRAKSIELQQQVSAALADAAAAYEAQTTHLERIRQLEEKVRQMETWGAEKEYYELKSLGWTALLTCSSQQNAAPNHRIGCVQIAIAIRK
jgi:hypothetical protein